MSNAIILSCPFCGGKSKLIHGEAGKQVWDHGKFSRIYCTQCQTRQLFHKTDSAAIKAWNTRMPSNAFREFKLRQNT